MIQISLNPRLSLLGVESLRYGGVWAVGILMIRCWGAGELLLAYESLTFLQQLLSFSIVWAAISEFQSQSRNTPHLEKNDSVIEELTVLLSWLGVLIGCFLAVWNYYQGRSVLLSLGFALHALFYHPTVLIEYRWIKEKRYALSLLLMAGSQFLIALSVVLPVVLDWPYEYTFLMFPVASVVRWIVLIRSGYLRPKRIKRSSIRARIQRLLPLSGSYLLSGSQLHWAGLVVGWLLVPDDFLRYRFGIRELPLVHLMATPIWMQAAQFIGRHRSSSSSTRIANWCLLYMKRETSRLVCWICPLHIILIILAPTLFNWFYGPQIQGACLPFQLMLLMPAAATVNPRGIMLGYDDRKALLHISVIEASLHAALSLVFTWWLGVAGTAVALLLSFAIERWLLVRRSLQLGIPSTDWIPVWSLIIFFALGIGILVIQHAT